MSPFYTKEQESWRVWGGEPKDIKTADNIPTWVSIYPIPEDSEKISVSASGDTFVRSEGETVIFPGQSKEIEREGFRVINPRTGGIVAEVIYSKRTIE